MYDWRLEQYGGDVLRDIQIDPATKAYVLRAGENFEWAVVRNGKIEVESKEMYGDVNCALRDALMFSTLGLVPVSVVDGGGMELVSGHGGLLFYLEQASA